MPYTSTLTLRDTRYRTLRTRERNRESALQAAETQVTAYETAIEEISELVTDLATRYNQRYSDTSTAAKEQICAAAYSICHLSPQGTLSGLHIERDRLTRARDNHRSALSQTKEALRAYPEGYTGESELHKRDVVTQMRAVPNIDARSIGIGTFAGDEPILRFIARNVVCQVDRLPEDIGWISTTGGETPGVFLQDCVVRANLNDGHIKIAPKRGERGLSPISWGGSYRVHPHILDHDAPCLGDFGGPIREAIHAKDWGTYAHLVRMFLGLAVTDDPAGKRWIEILESSISNALDRIFPNTTHVRSRSYTATGLDPWLRVTFRSYPEYDLLETASLRVRQLTPGVYELILDDEVLGAFSTHPDDSEFLYAFEYDRESNSPESVYYAIAA